MKTGIFCVEGEWAANIRHRNSVQLLVGFLSAANNMREPVYRRTATVEEFRRQIGKWVKAKTHNVGYFAFHGLKAKLCLDDEIHLTLEDLRGLLDGKCEGRHIVLGSCQTLAIEAEALVDFRKATKARSVSGYRKSPDWIEGSAFDIMLITNLLHFSQPSAAKSWLEKNCGGLVEKYGLVMSYRTKAQ